MVGTLSRQTIAHSAASGRCTGSGMKQIGKSRAECAGDRAALQGPQARVRRRADRIGAETSVPADWLQRA